MHMIGCSTLALIITVLTVLSSLVEASQSTRPAGSGVLFASQPANQGGAAGPSAPVAIAGKVTDSQGRLVEGAEVVVYQVAFSSSPYAPKAEVLEETTTGTDGTFTFSGDRGAPLSRGSCVVARKEGYAVGWAVRRMQGEQRFDITLEEPKDLSGVVVDEQGQPVAEAQVSIAAAANGKAADQQDPGIWTMPGFFNAKTDSDGRFVFASMPAGATFELLVGKPGYATVSTLGPLMMAGGPAKLQFSPGQAGIRMPLSREASIQGVVVERVGDQPVAGVAIMIQPDSRRPLMPLRSVISGSDGTFRMGDLAAGSYTVQLQTVMGRTAEWVADPVRVSVTAGQTKRDVQIQLVKGGIVEVLVKDAAGEPVGRASVNIRRVQDQQSFGGRTDENGLARVRVTAGQYLLSGVSRDGTPGRVIRQPEQVAVEEGATRRIEHVLSSAPKVAGIVRDQAGNPLAGVKFDVLPMTAVREEIMSDASGKFEVAWDPSTWGPQGTTFVLVARDVARNLAEAVDLDEQGGNLDVTLQPGVVVTGTVQSEQGQPLPGARVRVVMQAFRWGAPLNRSDLATAGPEGKFELKAIPPERQYTVSAVADGYGRRDVRVDPGAIKDSRFDAGPFQLTRADLSITGIVVDPNDKPVAGASVYGYGEGQPDPHVMQTDAEGKFAIKGVCPGPIRLTVNSSGSSRLYGSAQAEGGATDLRIVVSARSTTMAYMPRKSASLKGKPLPELKDLGIHLPGEAEGKMLLVCFWDMGQRPSRYGMTQLAARAAQLGTKGVTIVAVHAAKVEDGTLGQWGERSKIPFTMGAIPGDIDKTKFAWGVASLPHLILTDKKRAVVAEGFGLADLDKQIETAAGR